MTKTTPPVAADAARNALAAQDRTDKWQPLAGSVPVPFMKLHNGMCRWPIGDPHRLDLFRFCGCACPPAETYCEPHRQMAFNPNRVRTQVATGKPALAVKVA